MAQVPLGSSMWQVQQVSLRNWKLTLFKKIDLHSQKENLVFHGMHCGRILT